MAIPPRFDPNSIPRFSVIRVPYQFDGTPRAEVKLFVVLCHRNSFAICIKATSNVALYNNNALKNKGCVRLAAASLPCFPVETIIEPDNQFPIHHSEIKKAEASGVLEVHPLPGGFRNELEAAIRRSATLDARSRARILEMVAD